MLPSRREADDRLGKVELGLFDGRQPTWIGGGKPPGDGPHGGDDRVPQARARRAERGDARPAAGLALDQALALQVYQRLADGGAADGERGGNRAVLDDLTGGEVAVDDPGAQALDDQLACA